MYISYISLIEHFNPADVLSSGEGPRQSSQASVPQDLREKREELNRQILKEEEDKAKIQKANQG